MNETPCKVDGCDDPAKSRGWCRLHYSRWYRHGDPTVVMPKKGRPRVRLGLPHLYLDPPSAASYARGCKCDGCMDAMADNRAESKARIAAETAEMWAHVYQIRERMALSA